jgi:hypothetical protein
MVELPGVSPKRALLAVVATGIVVALAVFGGPMPTLELVGYALATVALGALAFDSVREKPGARVAQTAAITVALVLVYLAPPQTIVEAAVAVVAALALAGDLVTRMTETSPEDFGR